MRVVLAGASGLLGTALKASLRADGHEVKTLVRHATDQPGEDSWDPAQGLVDPQFLADADAVVCLSGIAVAGRRWNDAYKQQILRSRVDSVGTIARSLAEYGGPTTFVAASAVGYYGDTGDREVDEQQPPGESFLADVCKQWEAAAEPARLAGVRVAHPRTGLVLAADGELLKRIKPLAKAGVYGRLGNGRQYMPWISMADEIAALRFLLEHPISGPVNLTAPDPVTNAEFTKTLGRVLHRPTVFVVPPFGARAVLGEFAGEVLGGQRALPTALLDAGFRFAHTDLAGTLRTELG
ncbi:TIGR01777 family oxidoreductase [uncultured Jatrophihabitans sp.]|uniref:TIGR01777 family oxidoreductase n=1 Tax=uncultured Jatrophihabitans sp. TaxID=1610747 RepID=UPI0035C9905C